jgi:hypothetical protein
MTIAGEERPNISEALTIAGTVGNNMRVMLQPRNSIFQELIDFALVGAGGPSVVIINTCELGDPDGLAVLFDVVVDILLHTLERVLVDMDVSDVPVSRTGVEEWGQPILILLLAHGRRTKDGTLLSERGKQLVPLGGTLGSIWDARGRRTVAIGLVKSHHDLRSVAGGVGLEFMEALDIVGVGGTRLAIAPQLD